MPAKYDEYYSAQNHALGPVRQGISPTRTLDNSKARILRAAKLTV